MSFPFAQTGRLCLALILLLSACTPAGKAVTNPPPTSPVVPVSAEMTAAPTLQARASEPVRSLKDVKNALIEVRAEGFFQDPEPGKTGHRAGQGSGFLIDPSGIAVTDHHVVSGADSLQVWVGDDHAQTYPARVLAVSECSDLAVIQIEGSGFPYLQWRETLPGGSTPVYLAGFALSNLQFLLTKGVILAEETSGVSSWAESQPQIQVEVFPDLGQVGGPLVDGEGRVAGVIQSADPELRTAYALPAGPARKAIEGLQNSPAQETIGLNGRLVSEAGEAPAGLWISSVAAGSPAARAGLERGDLLLKLGEVDFTQASSLSGYCALLRSPAIQGVLPLQAYGAPAGAVLSGELNGRPIAAIVGPQATLALTPSDIVNPDATVPGELFISAEFTDSDNWYTFALPESDRYISVVRNERLYVQIDNTKTSVYAFHKLALPGNVRLEAGVKTIAGPNRNNISLICRATEKGWYEFSMNSGGYWFIWRYENGNYRMLNSGASLKIHMEKSANTMAATCVDQTLTLTVNESVLGTARDSSYQGEGQVGISVSTFDIPGAGVEFDWFRAAVP